MSCFRPTSSEKETYLFVKGRCIVVYLYQRSLEDSEGGYRCEGDGGTYIKRVKGNCKRISPVKRRDRMSSPYVVSPAKASFSSMT